MNTISDLGDIVGGLEVTVVKLATLTSSAQSINLAIYDGYQNFAIGKNIFMHITSAATQGPGWAWYRPYNPSINTTLSYNATTGVLTIPSSIAGPWSITNKDSGTSTYSISVAGVVYLAF